MDSNNPFAVQMLQAPNQALDVAVGHCTPIMKESPSDLPVRRSTRDIKRKKFDDEWFDNSAIAGAPKASPFKRGRSSSSTERTSTEAATTIVVGSNAPPFMLPPVSVLSSSCSTTAPPTATFQVVHPGALATQSFPSIPDGTSNTLLPSLSTIAPTFHHSAAAISQGPVVNDSILTTTQSFIQEASFVTPTSVPMTHNIVSTCQSKIESNTLPGTPYVAAAPLATSSSSKKRARQAHIPLLRDPRASLKDSRNWPAVDDLALITAVMQVNDLDSVYAGLKFTRKYKLEEIQSRWYSLLYDPIISKHSQEAMRQLTREITMNIQANTLFSRAEEKLLAEIPSNTLTNIQVFEKLLASNPDIFHYARSAKSLLNHWQSMKEYQLLVDQKSASYHSICNNPTFSEIEDTLESVSNYAVRDNFLSRELLFAEKQALKQIKRLENDLSKWRVLVEVLTGLPSPQLEANVFAELRGRTVRYLLKSKEVTVGRNNKADKIDVDLSLEGPAFNISRKQATIKLRVTGDFYIVNDGVRPIYIDGKPVLSGSKSKLNNNSVLEFSIIRLMFTVNHELIQAIKNESAKAAMASIQV